MAKVIESNDRSHQGPEKLANQIGSRLGINTCQNSQLDTVGYQNRMVITNETIPKELNRMTANSQGYISERVLLTCLALKDMLAQDPKCESLVAAFTLHTVLIGELQLSSRRLPCIRNRSQY